MKNYKRYRQRRKILPGFPREGIFQSKDEIDAYFAGDRIQCLLCGKWYRWLSHNHLGRIHNMTLDEYRERYGLPWERGLTASPLHKRFVKHGKKLAAERPELKEFLQEIRPKARYAPQRPRQPFTKEGQIKRALAMTTGRQNPWQRADFETILDRVREQQRSLDDVCRDADLPSKRTWNSFTKDHPEFRARLRQIYDEWPYAVQFKLCKRVSPQFRKDCLRLREQGCTASEIAKTLGVSVNNVHWAIRGVFPKTQEWQPRDYEAVLTRMKAQQRSLQDVLHDPDLPAKSAWQRFVKDHPEFKERVRQIYDSWPYATQVRLRVKLSPLRNDCLRLRDQELTRAEIAETLDVPVNTVRWALRGLKDRYRKWKEADFEALLNRMQTQQRNLYDVFEDSDLPGRSAWYRFVKQHPEFAERVNRIYAGWPYAVQAKLLCKFSPQFTDDCRRLRAQGMTYRKIAETLGVGVDAVIRHLHKGEETKE